MRPVSCVAFRLPDALKNLVGALALRHMHAARVAKEFRVFSTNNGQVGVKETWGSPAFP